MKCSRLMYEKKQTSLLDVTYWSKCFHKIPPPNPSIQLHIIHNINYSLT